MTHYYDHDPDDDRPDCDHCNDSGCDYCDPPDDLEVRDGLLIDHVYFEEVEVRP